MTVATLQQAADLMPEGFNNPPASCDLCASSPPTLAFIGHTASGTFALWYCDPCSEIVEKRKRRKRTETPNVPAMETLNG